MLHFGSLSSFLLQPLPLLLLHRRTGRKGGREEGRKDCGLSICTVVFQQNTHIHTYHRGEGSTAEVLKEGPMQLKFSLDKKNLYNEIHVTVFRVSALIHTCTLHMCTAYIHNIHVHTCKHTHTRTCTSIHTCTCT